MEANVELGVEMKAALDAAIDDMETNPDDVIPGEIWLAKLELRAA